MASVANTIAQKMQSLRLEADDNAAKYEELKGKYKTLEQENLAKEQEITSLTHRNQLLEGEVEKLETGLKEAKTAAAEGAQSGQQSEALQRRLQVLEEEAEQADKTLKETTEKCVNAITRLTFILTPSADSDRQTSSQVTTRERYKPSNKAKTSGRPNMRRWPRSTQNCRRR